MEDTPGTPESIETSKKHREPTVIAGNYQIGQLIGKGGFATVHKAINLLTGEVVAAKRFDGSQVSKSAMATINEEAELIKTLHHPNIVRFIELVKKKDLLVLVLEFVEGGSIASLVDQYGCLPESICLVYAPQILTGMDYLHQKGVIHRDIKGSNILITKSGQAKLSDFGVSSLLNDIEKRFSVVGTPYWMPPEVVDLKGWHPAGDVWSFGCTVIEMLTGVPPNFSCTPMAAMFKIVEEQITIPTEGISPELVDFLKQCFIKDFNQRPPASRLLQHSWISRVKEATNVPTDLPAVQQRLRGMTLQIEEADATKLRERLDSEALNYMKLRESAFVHNVPIRASQRVPLGVALDAESARNEIMKMEAAIKEEELRKISTSSAALERPAAPDSARLAGRVSSDAPTPTPNSARAATVSAGTGSQVKKGDTVKKDKDEKKKLAREESGSSMIGRVFDHIPGRRETAAPKTVSSATAKDLKELSSKEIKEMKSSEKYKAKLEEVKAERDKLKKKVDEQEDELDKLRHALAKTRTELEEQRTKVVALTGALEHLVKKDEARERGATHATVNFSTKGSERSVDRLPLTPDRKESGGTLERKDSSHKDGSLKPITPRSRDATKLDSITPRASTVVNRDRLVSPTRSQIEAPTVYGLPLEMVLERQKTRHPELRVPQVIDAALRFLIKHVSTEGLFRIAGTHARVQELCAKASSSADIEFDIHEVPHNVSAMVTKYLRELPEPLLGIGNYDNFLTAVDAPDALTLVSNLVRSLPFSNQFLLREVGRFCSMVNANAEYSKMGVDNLGRCIGPNILIGPPDLSLHRMQIDSDKVARVASLLIKDWRVVFSHIPDIQKEENFEFKFRTSHQKSVQGIAPFLTPNDVIAWTWDSSGSLAAYGGRNYEQQKSLPPDPKRGSISSVIAVGGELWVAAEKAVQVLNGETGQVQWEDTAPGLAGFSLALDGDNIWVATWPGLRCYSRKERKMLRSADTTKDVKILHVAGGVLWVGGAKAMYIYDCETLAPIREVKEHTRRVNAFVSIAAPRFVSVSDDQKCIVWDATTKAAVKVLDGHEGKAMCAAYAPGASVFFTASWDTTVRVWDCQSLACVRVLSGYHTDCISGLSAFWEPQLGDWLLWTASWDKHICSFKITPSGGNLPVLSLPAGPTSDTPAPQPSPQPSPPSGERGSKDKESSDKLEVKEKKEKGHSPRSPRHGRKHSSDHDKNKVEQPASPVGPAAIVPDEEDSVSYIDLRRKVKENEQRMAELQARKKALEENQKKT